MGLLHEALPASTLVVAIDPGKVSNRVWLSTGEAGRWFHRCRCRCCAPGWSSCSGWSSTTPDRGPVFAIEATGGLHQAWVRELNQRFPGSVRLFAPSETTAARAQLGSRGSRPTTGTAPR